MIKVVFIYLEGLKVGSFVKVDLFMVDDVYRYENGQFMVGFECIFFKGCDNMKKQFILIFVGIKYRLLVVDEEMGVVVVCMNFGLGLFFQGDGEFDVWYLFKIYDGLIYFVEVYCEIVLLNILFGWEQYRDFWIYILGVFYG